MLLYSWSSSILAEGFLEKICEVAEFESSSGRGIAIQIDVEDAAGMSHQIQELIATDLIVS